MSYPPAPPPHGYPPGPQPGQPGPYGGMPPGQPYGGPPAGWPPPVQPRSGGMGWVIGLVAGIVLVVAIGLTLWLTGVFESGSSATASRGTIDVKIDSPAASGAGCTGVVRDGEVPAGSGTDWNRVVVGGASVTWNGTPVDPITLRQYLDLTTTIRPVPVLITRVEPGASPAIVNRVREVIAGALKCQPTSL